MRVLSTSSVFSIASLCLSLAVAQDCGPAYTSAGVEATLVDDDFCAFSVKSNLQKPRGVIAVRNTILVVEADKSANKISAHWQVDGNGMEFESMTVVDATGIDPELNHGIAYHGGYLYASSETTGKLRGSCIWRSEVNERQNAAFGWFSSLFVGIRADSVLCKSMPSSDSMLIVFVGTLNFSFPLGMGRRSREPSTGKRRT